MAVNAHTTAVITIAILALVIAIIVGIHAKYRSSARCKRLYTIVCSTPQNHARVRHMRRLMIENSIKDFAFTWQHGLFVSKSSSEVQHVVRNHHEHDFNMHNIELYIAHCLTYLNILRWFSNSRIEHLLILEDDIIVADKRFTIPEHIARSPCCDVLMLEWCYGQCDRGDMTAEFVRNINAHCTAAVVWNQRAARKFLEFVEKRGRLFNIDELTAQFFAQRSIDCVYMNPPVVVQDRDTFTDGVSSNNGLDLCF